MPREHRPAALSKMCPSLPVHNHPLMIDTASPSEAALEVAFEGDLLGTTARLVLLDSSDGSRAAQAALAEVDKQRMQLGELTRQRDAAQLAAAEAVHVRIAKLGEALGAAQSQVEDREKELEADERVTKELREALAEAGRKGRELLRSSTTCWLTARFSRCS